MNESQRRFSYLVLYAAGAFMLAMFVLALVQSSGRYGFEWDWELSPLELVFLICAPVAVARYLQLGRRP